MLTDGKTQISIYSLTTMKKMYTLANALLDSRLESVRGEFTYSSFCGDMKYLASLFVAEDVESHVILWLWDKEKSYKSDKLFVGKSFKISCPLSTDVMFTSSGPNFVKLHYIGTNNMLTQTNLVPIPKERGMKIEKVIDQVWLHAMGARQKLAVLVDFEGTDVNKRFVVYIFEATEDSVLRDNDAFSPKLELKLSIPVYLLEGTFGFKLNRVVCTPRGFMLLGLRGYVLLYEKTEGKQVNYFHLCSLHTEDEGNLIAGTLAPSEGRLVVLSSNEENSFSAAETSTRLLTLPLPDTNDDRNKEVVVSNSEDITANGYHSQGVLGADMALQRPLLVTISSEGYARVWSYDKPVRCEFVEKLDDSPLAVAVHHNGLQVLISFRDKVRLYNILKNKLTVYKDTSLRSCQILRFSCGCQLWAGAQSSNIYIFDTKTFTMLNTLHASGSRQGVIRSLAWAPGDQVC
jgi:WD40 repeat protein